MEKDDEVAGKGASYTAEFWQYNARTARRWNIDPEFRKIPKWTPYVAYGDNPIRYTDPNGDLWGDDYDELGKGPLSWGRRAQKAWKGLLHAVRRNFHSTVSSQQVNDALAFAETVGSSDFFFTSKPQGSDPNLVAYVLVGANSIVGQSVLTSYADALGIKVDDILLSDRAQ